MKTAKTSKSLNLHPAPISRKAYLDLVARVYNVFPFGSAETDAMLEEMDYYIKHQRYSDNLSAELMYAFMFLAMDIDLALERTRTARLRASLRKAVDLNTKVVSWTMNWRGPSEAGYIFDGSSQMILRMEGGGRSSHPPYPMDAALICIRKRYCHLRELCHN